MPPVQPPQFGNIPPSSEGDPSLRRRITAELLEIHNILQETHLRERNVPLVVNLLTEWHATFCQFVRKPNQNEVMPDLKNVIHRFVEQLENILADPFHGENPYPPQLFGHLPLKIVQCVVAMAINPDSLLYSEKIYAAKPAPSPVFTVPNSFEEKLRMINMLREQRLKEDEQQLPGYQDVLGNLRKIEQEQREDLKRYGEQFREAIAPVAEAIQQLNEDVPKQREILIASVSRHKRNVEQLQKDLEVLEVDRRAVREGIEEQKKADLELKAAINRLEQSIENAKADRANDLLLAGGLMIVSAAITWGLSQYYYGVSVSLMQCSKTCFTVGISLGAAGVSKSSKGASSSNTSSSQNRR